MGCQPDRADLLKYSLIYNKKEDKEGKGNREGKEENEKIDLTRSFGGKVKWTIQKNGALT